MKGIFDILKKIVFGNFWNESSVQSQWSMITLTGNFACLKMIIEGALFGSLSCKLEEANILKFEIFQTEYFFFINYFQLLLLVFLDAFTHITPISD